MNATAGAGGLAGLWRSLSGTRPAAASSAPAPAPAPVPAGVLPIEPTHYQRLGLPEDCTEAEIEIAWHRVAAGLLPPRPPGERLKPPAASAGTAEEARTEQMRSDDRRLARADTRHVHEPRRQPAQRVRGLLPDQGTPHGQPVDLVGHHVLHRDRDRVVGGEGVVLEQCVEHRSGDQVLAEH